MREPCGGEAGSDLLDQISREPRPHLVGERSADVVAVHPWIPARALRSAGQLPRRTRFTCRCRASSF